MLAPPFVIDEPQIGEMVALIGRAVEHTVAQATATR
jgi:adenosylmethionine-8-amino-7-oxononanoate aminotransferase